MSFTAELLPRIQASGEEYGRSTADVDYQVGSTILGGIMRPEKDKNREKLAYANFTSGLREMLATDEQFRHFFDIDDKREHPIINGQVCDEAGKPMVEVTKDGRRASEQRCRLQPEFRAIVIRDIGDEVVARKVDELMPGQVFITRSMEPIHELRNHRKTYRDLGFREGLAYDQWYAKVDDGTLIAGSYSIDMNDEYTYRKQRKEMGFPLPDTATPNTIIQHGFEITASPEQAEQFVRKMRDDHYKRRGLSHKRYSISEFLEQNDEVVRELFDTYYPCIARVRSTGKNSKILQEFAATVLDSDADLKPQIIENLSIIAYKEKFEKEQIKSLVITMKDVVRYAVAEELRKGLPQYIGEPITARAQDITWTTQLNESSTLNGASVSYVNQIMANNVSTGVRAGRGYGGCAATELANDSDNTDGFGGSGHSHSSQEAYGGKGYCKELKDGDITNCPHCKKKNVRATVKQKSGGEVQIYCDNPSCKFVAPEKKNINSTVKRRWIYSS